METFEITVQETAERKLTLNVGDCFKGSNDRLVKILPNEKFAMIYQILSKVSIHPLSFLESSDIKQKITAEEFNAALPEAKATTIKILQETIQILETV